MEDIVKSENSIKAGIELSVLRKWVHDPKKGKIGAKLLKAGLITEDAYFALEDGRNVFWNHKQMLHIYINTGLDVYGIASAIDMSPETIKKHIQGSNSEKVESRLNQLAHNIGL